MKTVLEQNSCTVKHGRCSILVPLAIGSVYAKNRATLTGWWFTI